MAAIMPSIMTETKIVCVDGHIRCRVGESIIEAPQGLVSKLNDVVADYFSVPSMMPDRLDLPFFAYGLFKVGQLGFRGIRNYVKHVDTAEMEGWLWERDGVPLLGTNDTVGRVSGTLIWFDPGGEREGYLAIAGIEPQALFEWRVQMVVGGQEANVLAAISLRGADELEVADWDGRSDPVLFRAPQFVGVLKRQACALEFGSVDRMLMLEAAYMLLLTAIERYTSLQYHQGNRISK